jgi:ABC-type protease/lipase transport system fused ATPase/permease subunit
MYSVSTTVACPLHNSFRVQQVAGLFDLPLAERLSETFVAELPNADDAWTIGAIVGPSGSGKSTLARAAFGPAAS